MKTPIRLTYLAQAGFLLSTPQTTLGIDLYLSDGCERLFGFKRRIPAPFRAAELKLDYLVATHAHADHLDVDALPVFAADPHLRFIGATDCRPVFAEAGIAAERCTLLRAGDTATAGDFTIQAVAADHGELAPEALGLLIACGDWHLYITGDTCFNPDRLLPSLGTARIDVLIAPVNGAFGNLTKAEAAKLANLIQPRCFIASHFGMFDAHDGDAAPWERIPEILNPAIRFAVMQPGESEEFFS